MSDLEFTLRLAFRLVGVFVVVLVLLTAAGWLR